MGRLATVGGVCVCACQQSFTVIPYLGTVGIQSAGYGASLVLIGLNRRLKASKGSESGKGLFGQKREDGAVALCTALYCCVLLCTTLYRIW